MISVTSGELQALLAQFFWPFARILALMLTAPVFSETMLPVRLRIGLAIIVTAMLSPTLAAPPAVPTLSLAGFVILARELLIGAALGFTMRIVFAAVQATGELAGLQMGLGYATLFDPQTQGQTPVVGQFLNLFAVLAFLSVDGHLYILRVLAETFRSLPVGGGLHAEGLLALGYWGGEVFRAGVLLCLPLIGALLIANLALGILSRAAPQLNLFAVGFPLTLALGLIMLALSMPLFAPQLEHLFADGFSRMRDVASLLYTP